MAAVTEFPPREFCSRRVSLESRYGTWPFTASPFARGSFASCRMHMPCGRKHDNINNIASFHNSPPVPIMCQ
eukprot:6218007-Pyramimonas_sp.AAC.1